MGKVEEAPAHREMREALRHIALGVKGLGLDEFDMQKLKDLNICIDPMELDETSCHKPLYFAPYPDHQMPEPDEEALGGIYKGQDGEREPFTRPVDRAYGTNIYLSNYLSHCDYFAEGERVP